MKNIVKYGWWTKGAGWDPEEAADESSGERPEGSTLKTVMVYRLDRQTMGKEPVGILVERRKAERGDNVVGMLHRARKEFSETEPEAQKILIGDYV